MRQLRISLVVIGVVQAVFGVLFLVAPTAAPGLLALATQPPAWVNWLFAMMAARFLGYAVGMGLAARDPARNESWINTMIGIQVIDWVATLAFVLTGTLTLRNVTSAAILPPMFMAALLYWHPRRWRDLLDVAAIESSPSRRGDPARPGA